MLAGNLTIFYQNKSYQQNLIILCHRNLMRADKKNILAIYQSCKQLHALNQQ